MAVEVLDGRADLVQVALHLDLVEALSPAEKLIQRLILAKLEQDVDVLGVLEEVLEPHDVVVVETAVDLDLGHQLLLRAGLGQGGLRDDLGGRDSLRLEVCELVALGEAALSQKLPAKVLLDADVAIELDDLLLNDDLRVILLLVGRGRGRLSRGLGL